MFGPPLSKHLLWTLSIHEINPTDVENIPSALDLPVFCVISKEKTASAAIHIHFTAALNDWIEK